ncbi:S8 family serine peptidase [Clostridioides difficile]|nr:S8 family serine peptidase [Clostridioides difficile]
MNSIAIIDSGIDTNFKEFRNKNIKYFNINTYENSIKSVKDFSGHGTACAAEILRQNPKVSINVIKVLNENSQSSIKKIIESIEYASEMQDVKIISLSCSTFQNKYLEDFRHVINYANEKDKLLVCSSDNKNKVSYPSYLDGVIGVQRCIANINKYWFDKNAVIECVCKAEYRLLPSINKNYKLFGGNSYCTAHFCGLVSRFLKNNFRMENKDLIDIITKNADRKKWSIEDLNLKKPLKIEYSNRKYDYFKLKILSDSIKKFKLIENKNIETKPIYSLVGIDNIYFFLKYLENKLSQNIIYNEVTNENLISIYSLYNFIFKDE